MAKIKIALFHYHFLPGGVTTAASLAVNALLEYGVNSILTNNFQIEEIAFISGREENLENLVSEKIKIPSASNVKIGYEICRSVDYISDNSQRDDSRKRKDIAKLFEKYSSYIWWIHNYHLGKNPLFTSLLTEHLSENSSQKAILHIHDFPECGRLSNYRYLTGDVKTLYPLKSNIRYAVINARDKRYLINAGIPETHVNLLYDPVPDITNNKAREGISLQDAELQDKAKKMLSVTYGKYFPGFNPDKPFALYPVRTIRRKNILEAALLGHITGEGFNLVVTLPGISEQEKNYSGIVKTCFENGWAPGIWGCGTAIYGKAAQFNDVIASSDFIISSSLLEGFGYLFIDSLRWGKPLAARYLDITEGFNDIFDNTASFFYHSINVPLNISEREIIMKKWKGIIKTYSSVINSSMAERIDSEITSVFNGEYADFSYLPVIKQAEILKQIKNEFSFKNDIKQINAKTTVDILNVIKMKQNFDSDKALEYFSFKSFAHNFSQIISSLYENNPASGDGTSESQNNADISSKMLSFFIKKEFLRIILAEK
ncbi:MAG: hypothetical protein RBT69_11260 [Spirochaetia bacterium]|jgi:hypothetical protein|nr:hypothetical protein [Spirochaetia bacterium]